MLHYFSIKRTCPALSFSLLLMFSQDFLAFLSSSFLSRVCPAAACLVARWSLIDFEMKFKLLPCRLPVAKKRRREYRQKPLGSYFCRLKFLLLLCRGRVDGHCRARACSIFRLSVHARAGNGRNENPGGEREREAVCIRERPQRIRTESLDGFKGGSFVIPVRGYPVLASALLLLLLYTAPRVR